MMKSVVQPLLIPAVVAAGIALAPLPLSPNPGDQCWNWHATTEDSGGRTMTCTHTADSGHLMYWELGGPQDTIPGWG